MKRLLALLLILPALGLAQSRFGHGGSGTSVSAMLPIIADSTDWTAGSHVHAIKPKGGKSIEADSGKFGALEVTGVTTLDGELNMVTIATEQVKLGTGSDAAPELSSMGDTNTGIRFPGSDVTTFVQGGAEKFRADPNGINVGGATTPKAKLQVTATGMSAVDYYKGLRLSNPDAATVGVQALSPALVFRGAGWKTDATAGSDSVLWAMYVVPVQGSSEPISRFYLDSKNGAGSWTNNLQIQNNGSVTSIGNFYTTKTNAVFSGTSGSTSFGGEDDIYICIDTNNDDANKSVIFYKNGIYGGANASEVARITEAGYLGVGTGSYAAAKLHANNNNVWSVPLFRLGRDKYLAANIDSVVLNITGSGKTSFSTSLADTAANFNVQTNITRWDSLFTQREASNVADDGSIIIATGVSGWGECMAGDNQEWAHFRFSADGTVTLIANTTNVTNTDSDDNLCIYDVGSGMAIKNRLGTTKKIALNINYYTN